jgi:5-dehydro-2-deoxygluconokinase
MAAFSRNNFLVLGRAGLDLYADPPGAELEHAHAFTSALGGSAANIAAGIVRLGGSAALLSVVSDDAVGRFVRNELKRYMVNAKHLHTSAGEVRTSLAVVETRLQNCQSVIYRNGAADFELTTDHVKAVDWAEFGALIVTGTALAAEPSRSATIMAMDNARANSMKVIIDIDYRPYSWGSADDARTTLRRAAETSDIIVGNDVEFDVMAGGKHGFTLAQDFAQQKHKIIIYKRGENGSVFFTGGTENARGIFRVTALKPTGAGDAFMAALVTGLATGLEVARSVERGSAAAAIVVSRVGCAPAMPTPTELSQFIASHAMTV